MHQYTGLVPVNVVPGDLPANEQGRHNEKYAHGAPGRRYIRKEPGNFFGVGEGEEKLIDDAVGADSAGEEADGL